MQDKNTTKECIYCGPTCYGGAAHHARMEDGSLYADRATASRRESMSEMEQVSADVMPCEWYGKSLGEHDWLKFPWGKRCSKCKVQEVSPTPADQVSVEKVDIDDLGLGLFIGIREQVAKEWGHKEGSRVSKTFLDSVDAEANKRIREELVKLRLSSAEQSKPSLEDVATRLREALEDCRMNLTASHNDALMGSRPSVKETEDVKECLKRCTLAVETHDSWKESQR